MKKAAFLALFLLPVLILFPHLEEFPYQAGAIYSDLVVSHYPNGLYLQHALWEWKTIPLWSPAILSGYPFAANPLSGLFYPPGWLALAFPLPLGFNIVLILHLILGGIGMYCLLCEEGLSEPAALLGALAFEALPKLFAHLGTGHLTLVYAVCWTPWLLYAERKMANRAKLRWVIPGALLGMIALADVRWAAYAGLFWLAYSLRPAVRCKRLIGEPRQTGWKPVLNWALARFSNALFALLVAAPLLLPLAQYTLLSTRSALTEQDSLTLSLPPGQLLGLIYPNIGGSAEWVLYPGAVVLLLAIYALAVKPARRASAFWLSGILVTLLMALGSFLPIMPLIARLPGMDLLRVPPRVLFLTGLCSTAASAFGLNHLLHSKLEQNHGNDRSALVLFGITTFVVFFGAAGGVMVNQPLVRIQFFWGAVVFFLAAALILLARAGKLPARAATVSLLVVCLIDLILVNGLGLDFRSYDAVFADGRQAASYINEKTSGTPYRVYSPSYSIPQHVAAWSGLELADGIDPLQLAAYARFMEGASGVTQTGYSVALPPFQTASPAIDNQYAVPNAEMLGLLSVGYVVSAFPISTQGLVLEKTFGETFLYRNTLALPRAWVQAQDAPLGKSIHPVASITHKPNEIAVQVQGPGLLVLSELAYPGWQVTVDGIGQQIETASDLFRAVRLPSGNHQVVFFFRPVPVYVGLALALLAWALLTGIWLSERKKGYDI